MGAQVPRIFKAKLKFSGTHIIYLIFLTLLRPYYTYHDITLNISIQIIMRCLIKFL